jgi:2-hydroxychromene-2-carboxylate isomerase
MELAGTESLEGPISLDDLRSRRDARERTSTPPRGAARVEFYFDIASPFTYLAAERVERTFTGAVWTPASNALVRGGREEGDVERERATARAAALRLPLVWPAERPQAAPRAMRAAARAAELGRGGAFVLAASRLAWAGGYEPDAAEVLAEAAAAAGVVHDEIAAAADDASRDAAFDAAARRIVAAGADRLPALVVEAALFAGEERIGDALAHVRWLARGA